MTEIAPKPPEPLSEYISKLHKMAEGAKRALAEGKGKGPLDQLDQREQREHRERAQWWDGYTQALDDMFEAMMGSGCR